MAGVADRLGHALMWEHAEYIKLLRSMKDGKVYDIIPEVSKRYPGKREERERFEV